MKGSQLWMEVSLFGLLYRTDKFYSLIILNYWYLHIYHINPRLLCRWTNGLQRRGINKFLLAMSQVEWDSSALLLPQFCQQN